MIGGLVAVIVMAWLYILTGAGLGMSAVEMTAMPANMEMMSPAVWTPGYASLMVLMWWVMMIAMMLPSAAPMILLYAAINRKKREQGTPYAPTGIFASGYLAVWGGFSLAATGLQWGLERSSLVSSMMATTSVTLGGILLIAAGVWQLTPLKYACLRHCRSPIHYLSSHWRTGRWGALRMGLEHGAYCLGCCWFLMGLLFYGGVMNLYWIAGLALYVLVEKTVPAGHWVGIGMGLVLIAWGGVVLFTGL